MRPGDDGCFTINTNIRIITMLGNSKTKPKGMEMEEFPRRRMRLFKTFKPGSGNFLSFLMSLSGEGGGGGSDV